MKRSTSRTLSTWETEKQMRMYQQQESRIFSSSLCYRFHSTFAHDSLLQKKNDSIFPTNTRPLIESNLWRTATSNAIIWEWLEDFFLLLLLLLSLLHTHQISIRKRKTANRSFLLVFCVSVAIRILFFSLFSLLDRSVFLFSVFLSPQRWLSAGSGTFMRKPGQQINDMKLEARWCAVENVKQDSSSSFSVSSPSRVNKLQKIHRSID